MLNLVQKQTRNLVQLLLLMTLPLMLPACTQMPASRSRTMIPVALETQNGQVQNSQVQNEQAQNSARAGRKVIWNASQELRVNNTAEAAQDIEASLTEAGGYIQSSVSGDENFVKLQARIPAQELRAFLDELAASYEEEEREIKSGDVTLQYVDLDARLKNSRTLRDRLLKLLETTDVLDEILRVEQELARVQTTVDKLEAQMRLLEQSVELSSVEIHLQRSRVQGPIVLAWHGAGWVLSKLFFLD